MLSLLIKCRGKNLKLLMDTNIKRRINYCLIGGDAKPHVIFSFKWQKGNLYFINTNFDAKISYHAPRDGKSQVHIKINNTLPNKPDFTCPIEDIKGVRPVGGSGVQLRLLEKLPIRKEKFTNFIIDPRPFHISPLSQVQWYWYLVEPGKMDLLEEMIAPHKKSEFSEFLTLHIINDCTPWIATEFSRIRDENPKWYEK